MFQIQVCLCSRVMQLQEFASALDTKCCAIQFLRKFSPSFLRDPLHKCKLSSEVAFSLRSQILSLRGEKFHCSLFFFFKCIDRKKIQKIGDQQFFKKSMSFCLKTQALKVNLMIKPLLQMAKASVCFVPFSWACLPLLMDCLSHRMDH